MIKINNFLKTDFYFTIKNKQKCIKEGIEYISPLNTAIDKSTKNDIVIRRQSLGKYNNTYNSYGVFDYSKLEQIWTTNNHFYEILKEERKPYFDIEFTTDKKGEFLPILNDIIIIIKKSFTNIGIKVSKKDVAMTYVKGIGEQGIFKDKIKHSIHIIINNGYKFKTQKDIKKYSKYLEELILTQKSNNCIDCCGNLAIDFQVYGNNQAFKLPFNSKAGSTRIHNLINTKFTKLNDYLISYNLNDYKCIDVSGIKLSVNEKIKKIKKENNINVGNWTKDTIINFISFLENSGNNIETIPKDKPSLKPDYLIKSIYNCDEMPYDIYFCLGSACKRVFGEKEGFKFWNEWTKKSIKHNENYNYSQFQNCSADSCGFNTLLSMATYCNPEVKKLVNKPTYDFLFEDTELNNKIQTKIINERYLSNKIDFTELLKNNDNVFIKSPMGTGKSYSLHNLLKDEKTYKNVVYLSSRQAFSCSMANEFKNEGFVNYLDKVNFRGYNNRVIISLESISKIINYKKIDLLIIDESESIFNIVSSETLIKNNFAKNLNVFRDMIIHCKKVLIMDAYLSNRSINPIKFLRNITTDNSKYIINNFKYEERQFYETDKQVFILEIEKKLKDGKRCCLVTGSRKLGDMLLQHLKTKNININHIFYSINNKLENNINVDEKWKDTQLLIYSPTITCGISYDNKLKPFDNLFIYAVNKGSTHFRDIIQAHKRIRNFTDKKICVCLNTQFQGFCDNKNPIREQELREYLTTERQTLFNNLNIETESIEKDEAFKNWIFDIHLSNILEINNSQKYLQKIAYKYFELENIKKIDAQYDYSLLDIMSIQDVADDNWNYSKISDINWSDFFLIKDSLKKNIKLTHNDITCLHKFIYENRLKQGVSKEEKERVFNVWYKECLRDNMKKIKLFKQMIYTGRQTWIEQSRTTNKLEFYEKLYLSFSHIEKIFKKLKLIENNKLNIKKTFTTLDFKDLVEEYKEISGKAINDLFIGSYYDNKSKKGGNKEVTSRTIHTYLNKMVKDYFNYEIVGVKKMRRRINGKIQEIQEYKIEPANLKSKDGEEVNIKNECLFGVLDDKWGELGMEYDLE